MVATGTPVVIGLFMVATGTPVVMGLFMVAIGTAAVARGTGCGCTNGRVSYVYTGAATGFLRRQSGIAPPAPQHSSKIQQGRTVTKNHAHHGQPPPSVVVTVVVVLGLGLGLGLEEATNAHKRHRSRTVAVNRMVILPSPCLRDFCCDPGVKMARATTRIARYVRCGGEGRKINCV